MSFRAQSRRAFLRAAGGAAVYLPISHFCLRDGRVAEAAEAPVTPRLVTLYFPNGCHPELFTFDYALSPLAGIRDKVTVLAGLVNPLPKAYGGDPHQQGGVNTFTGAPLATDTTLLGGTSIDQAAADVLNGGCMLKSPLVAGVWRSFVFGEYRSVSWARRSWKNGESVQPLQNPKDIFDRLFGGTQSGDAINASILDNVIDQYKSLTSSAYPLSSSSKALLKDHLDQLREIEAATAALAKEQDRILECKAQAKSENIVPMDGIYTYEQFARVYELQIDLVFKALQCGLTNTASLMFGCAGEEYYNATVANKIAGGGALTDHSASHPSRYDYNVALKVFVEYRRFHLQNVRRLADLLDSVKDPDGRTMLDNSLLVAASEFGESDAHTASPHPHVLVGGAGGALKTGSVHDASAHTINDAYVTALNAVGVGVNTFGVAAFCKGPIKGILA